MGGAEFIDLTSKTRQRTVVSRLDSLAISGKAIAPVVIELDMTSFCDFGCPECISADVLGVSRLSRPRLLELTQELAESGVKAVILTGGGEPLRHHAAREVISHLRDAGLAVGLITNGYLLRNLPPDVIRAMAWIRVSVDAATAETFALMRPHPDGPSAFDRVLGGISHVAQAGGRVGASFVAIVRAVNGGRITNIGEIGASAALARDLGCAYLNVKAMQNADHTLFEYEADELDELARQLDGAERLNGDGFEVVRSGNVHAVLNMEGAQVKSYSRCVSAGLRALITPEGMYPCAYHRGNKHLRVDAPPSNTHFVELWRRYRPESVRPTEDCTFHCARHEANVQLESALAGSASAGFASTPDADLFI